MRETSKRYTSVEEYLADQEDTTREMLESLREVIKRAAPQAKEKISYNMPAYDVHGVLVYFAGYKGHIGFYPTGSGVAAFQKEIAGYESSKGAIRFPLDRALPKTLITRIVKYRLKQNLEKATRAPKKTGKTPKKATKGK
jgi:uncharacterized protein YdhG (YjbR/CyaY superfamily)